LLRLMQISKQPQVIADLRLQFQIVDAIIQQSKKC
jgi:hypothetical protein